MLDLSDRPTLDKHALIGGCVRLRLQADAAALASELGMLPEDLWGSRGGRGGVHGAAEAIFLRGHAPAEGDLPIEDRPALAQLPFLCSFVRSLPGELMRCLLARLPAGGTIAPHVDRAPYFHKTVRVHVPILTNPAVTMLCGERIYTMQAGEVWAINNVAVHAVWNRHAALARTHLICDYVPDASLVAALQAGERDLGVAAR